MDTQNFQKFCPVCKLVNDANATVCQHCQAPLNASYPTAPTTRRIDKTFELSEELREQITREHVPPPFGMSLYILISGETVALCKEREFFLGRAEEASSPTVIDLSDFEAFEKGVSRRHAIIKVINDNYVLIDNNSSNGTWLNGDRLLPNNPHILTSGSVIQLGRLKLVAVFSNPPE
jgi:hypothetical protein